MEKKNPIFTRNFLLLNKLNIRPIYFNYFMIDDDPFLILDVSVRFLNKKKLKKIEMEIYG